MHKWALVLALGSTLSFSLASVLFTEFSRRRSVLWMNGFKAVVAFLCFLPTVFVLRAAWPEEPWIYVYLLLSGVMGLMIGDLFLFHAYIRIGTARTLMIFGFSPIFLGFASSIVFGEVFPLVKLLAVISLMICLFIFSFEKFRKSGHWEMRGLAAGFCGVMLDACGLMLTKASYVQAAASGFELHPAMVNTIRCIGALCIFPFLSWGFPLKLPLVNGFLDLNKLDRQLVVLASFLGTFLALFLYLTAIKYGHIATVSAIVMMSPIVAALFECLRQKTWPNRYLLLGLVFFLIGLAILFFS